MILLVVRASRIWLAAFILLLGAAFLVRTAPARAEVMQTGGDIIPKQPGAGCNSNASICINGNEKTEGGKGDIDGVATATISQETFNPLCELTFRVVARGADYKNTFGWYAVKRDAKGNALAPVLADLHVFLGCADAIGAEKTLTLPKDTAEIGFFLANDQGKCVATMDDPLGPTLTAKPKNLFFSQRKFNSDGDGLIHLLVWQSHASPNAFYFGWEDQSGGGDNDFEDLLTYVTGIQCAGGGEPCHIEGADGVCGDGVMQCQDGALVCLPTQTPSAEKCNALDDDCNGETDDGDDLCPKGEICVKGSCQPPCGTGEFRCGGNDVCVEGVCVEADCATKNCPDGSVCHAGKCVAACDDVVCPYGATCRNGVCVDVCEGVTCDPGYVCEARESADQTALVGVCSSCDCRGCGDGQSCVEHSCIDVACANQTCDAGTRCVDGDCVDNCDGASCPAGQFCASGACVSYAPGAGGAGNAAGGAGGDDGGIVIENPNGNGNGIGGEAGQDGGGVLKDHVVVEVVGCGCATPGGSASGLGAVFLASLLGASRFARRRRRDKNASRPPSG
jgi:hypothetical protein